MAIRYPFSAPSIPISSRKKLGEMVWGMLMTMDARNVVMARSRMPRFSRSSSGPAAPMLVAAALTCAAPGAAA